MRSFQDRQLQSNTEIGGYIIENYRDLRDIFTGKLSGNPEKIIEKFQTAVFVVIIEDILVREPVRTLDTLNLPLTSGVLLGSGGLHVSLLMSPELEWKWKHFATGGTGVLGDI